MDRERLILDSAQGLFHEFGFGSVSVNQIGQRAGVTGPAIYRHFISKDEILATLFDEASDALITRVGSTGFDSPLDELRYLAAEHARFAIEHRELASILIRDNRSLPPTFRRRHERRERPYFERWTRCIRAAFSEMTAQECTTATFASIHMLNSVGNWPAAAHKVPDLANMMADMVLGGLTAIGNTSPTRPDPSVVLKASCTVPSSAWPSSP